jgi:V8-like Glu-specific endopeptidase
LLHFTASERSTPLEIPLLLWHTHKKMAAQINRSDFLKSTCVRFDYHSGGGGSGFHLGNGWIVTNSHVVVKGEVTAANNPEVAYRDIISQATITINGHEFSLATECAMVVFTRISAGIYADFTQGDLALVHVPRIKNFPAVSVGDSPAIGVNTGVVATTAGDLCTTFHFGWVGNARPDEILTSSNEVVIVNTAVGAFHFERTSECVGGSSGSPVFSGDLSTLLGVHFASGGCAVKQAVLFGFMQNSLSVTAYTDRIADLWPLRNQAGCADSITSNLSDLIAFLETKNYGVFLM